ncbi:hypothetical protein PAXRUDRAFT_825611 [Paxillus rubicundulus Ve08.2h10]|uniref:Carboxylic ester hydrolase n=1 Tax=Paxillus rubicundulus Ve08.2h10 TaxID=930991 RepID=A0A0D0E5S5_9AGAM|nr:hypothetical protein PAXRUDRAFT_825611 [Paxillus rubicundulus Ve08.2h10]
MSQIALLLLLVGLAGASLLRDRSCPTVTLDSATVTGVSVPSKSVNEFLGIPFAQPPTGNLRFRLPQALPPYNASFSATAYGPACPQQALTLLTVPGLPAEALGNMTSTLNRVIAGPFAEDCLTLNVVAPADATPNSKLPVVVWIYGGGFEVGGTSKYDGGLLVNTSVSLDVPVIYVSMNYRLNAFGFLPGREVKDAGVGNLGLHDQRLALYWIQKYIGAFGGDPTKVTIWGESAGAISVALHMVTNGGNPDGLFRAAFMQSGSPLPVGDITHGQKYYDALVCDTGCSNASDTLQCLRDVPYERLLDAVNKSPNVFSYQSLSLAWLPRVDGIFLTDSPQHLVQQGSVANVPFVTGDCDDEGTIFSFSNLNITTDTQFKEYIQTYWFPHATPTTIEMIMRQYSDNTTYGSPFDTGGLNALTPQFKRMAAFLGDAMFQAPRRFFLQNRWGKQALWAYVSKRQKTLPFLGSYHASDLANVYGGQDMTSYLVQFVSNLNPNGGTELYWPQYTIPNPQMLEFLDGSVRQGLTLDLYRVDPIAFLSYAMLVHPPL